MLLLLLLAGCLLVVVAVFAKLLQFLIVAVLEKGRGVACGLGVVIVTLLY